MRDIRLHKPVRGAFTIQRKQAKADIDRHELAQKAIVRKRDKTCRWPQCGCAKLHLRLEVAHLVAKSLGGASDAENMIQLCFQKHQGTPSLHSGDLKIEPKTAAGANGPCDFLARAESGQFEIVASERYIGVPETHGA